MRIDKFFGLSFNTNKDSIEEKEFLKLTQLDRIEFIQAADSMLAGIRHRRVLSEVGLYFLATLSMMTYYSSFILGRVGLFFIAIVGIFVFFILSLIDSIKRAQRISFYNYELDKLKKRFFKK